MRTPVQTPVQTGPLMNIELADEAATCALAHKLAGAVQSGDVIALSGDLGSGKSVFARAFINARSSAPQDVPSPTYTLVQTYDVAGGTIYHFDLYRIEYPSELEELGMEDAFDSGISLIEWPDRMGGLLPADRLDVLLAAGDGEGQRLATLIGAGNWAGRIGILAND